MKINTKTWHYRLVNTAFEYPSQSLCWYFWQTIASMLFCSVVILLMLSLVVSMFVVFFDSDFTIFAIAGWLVTGVISFVIAHSCRSHEGFWFKIRTIRNKSVSKGVFSQVIFKGHRKICPIIEFTNEENQIIKEVKG